MGSILILAVMFGALYVFMILPQQRRVKAHKALLSNIQVGDMVMTNGGIYGAVAEVEADVVWIEVAPDVELKVSKAMIADKAPDDTGSADTDSGEDADDTDDDVDDDVEDDADDAELAEQGDEG